MEGKAPGDLLPSGAFLPGSVRRYRMGPARAGRDERLTVPSRRTLATVAFVVLVEVAVVLSLIKVDETTQVPVVPDDGTSLVLMAPTSVKLGARRSVEVGDDGRWVPGELVPAAQRSAGGFELIELRLTDQGLAAKVLARGAVTLRTGRPALAAVLVRGILPKPTE